MGRECDKVVECLICKCEALTSIPCSNKKKRKKNMDFSHCVKNL
jgi:hypothetical protein